MTDYFTTDRLIIEPLSESDTDLIIELVNSEGWIKFIGHRSMKSEADACAYIQRVNANQNVKYWIAKLKDTKKSIGLVTLIKRDYLEHSDIGFAFLPAFSNKGYAYEATRSVLIDWVKCNGHTYVLGETLPENNTSIKLLRKLGLKFEKEIEIENKVLHIYGVAVNKL